MIYQNLPFFFQDDNVCLDSYNSTLSKSRSEPLDLKNKALSMPNPVVKSPRQSRLIPGVRIKSLKLFTKAEEQKLQALEEQRQQQELLLQTANATSDPDDYEDLESETDLQGSEHDSDEEDTFCVTLKPDFHIGKSKHLCILCNLQ